jgi:prepilin-type N-terminal cleavage/methylation domain-containing protein
MKTNTYARRSASRGLTLIELVVVLAILVALAGLIIGNFPGIVKRAGRSSSATSIQDVTRAVQYAYTTTLTYPSGYDSLLQAAGATLYTKLPSAAGLTAGAFAGTEEAALAKLGVTTTYEMDPLAVDATWSATMNAPVMAPAGTTDKVANVAGLTVKGLYPQEDALDTYYIFGIGKLCDMVGPSKNMVEAPTHFGDSATENPKDFYGRFGLIYGYNLATDTARFVGAVAFTANGLVATEGNIKEYWNN